MSGAATLPFPRTVAVIPARHGSSRLPGKPLADVGGQPLIAHVVSRARAVSELSAIIVATDHEEIAEAARQAGAEARITRSDHPTGSDRIGEILPDIDAEIVVNLQGDEPDLDPDLVGALVRALASRPDADVATASAPWPEGVPHDNPDRVKVVTRTDGLALYFSRAPVPWPRGVDPEPPRLHLGIYAYRRTVLERFLAWDRGPLERTEELEQLRLLEHGASILVVPARRSPGGIDTPEDLAALRKRMAAQGSESPED